ncbi:uncharacterized protein ACJ7VT_022048 isoform 2-T2 [Polymixia lowei]
MGNQSCSPSLKTVDCLYQVVSYAGLVPDTSLDTSLDTFLSLNSSWALEQQYSSLQQNLSQQQMSAFNRDLQTTFRGSTTVSYGGVGVVSLALSVLFEVLAHHQRTQPGLRGPQGSPPPPEPDPIRRMFVADGTSEVGSIVSEFLKQVKQWVNGAALHVHIFLHWKRLTDPSAGDVDSLKYLQAMEPLLKTYTQFLHRTVRETPPSAPGPTGLLVVEPLRNVTHGVQHRTCESAAIQRALVERFLSVQDVQRGKDFFQSSQDHHDSLMAQQADFMLKM